MSALQTTDQYDKNLAQGVAANLQQGGYPVGSGDVAATTAATPVTKTAELHEAGAEIVGEDLSHLVGSAVGDLTTGSVEYRTTKSGRFLQMIKERLGRKNGSNSNK